MLSHFCVHRIERLDGSRPERSTILEPCLNAQNDGGFLKLARLRKRVERLGIVPSISQGTWSQIAEILTLLLHKIEAERASLV